MLFYYWVEVGAVAEQQVTASAIAPTIANGQRAERGEALVRGRRATTISDTTTAAEAPPKTGFKTL